MMSTWNNLLIKTLALVAIVWLVGCKQHHQIVSDLESYSARLQSFTEIQLEDSSDTTSFNTDFVAPKKSELRIDIPEVSINLREFYALKECSLNQLVAERNTSLGKMQLPSSRFAYETSLLAEFDACKEKLVANGQKNNDLLAKLEIWSTTKHEQLPSAYSNLLTQSDEVYGHFFRASDYLSGDSEDNFTSVKQAFKFLLEAQQNKAVDLSALEYHLQQLDESPLIARKWKTQKYLTNELNRISVLLNEFYQTNTCETIEDENRINIMRNIFTKFFAETIQPLASELNKYHYQISPILQKILASPDFPEPFVNFVAYHENDSFQQYTQSMREHIVLWQDIFAKCS